MQVVALAVYGVSRGGASQVSRSGGVRRRLSRAAGSSCISEDAVQPARIPQDTAPGVAAVVRVSRCGGWRRRVSLPAGSPCIPEDPVHPARIQRDVAPLSPPYRRLGRYAVARGGMYRRTRAGSDRRQHAPASVDTRRTGRWAGVDAPLRSRRRTDPESATQRPITPRSLAAYGQHRGVVDSRLRSPGRGSTCPPDTGAAARQGSRTARPPGNTVRSATPISVRRATGRRLQLLDLHGDV